MTYLSDIQPDQLPATSCFRSEISYLMTSILDLQTHSDSWIDYIVQQIRQVPGQFQDSSHSTRAWWHGVPCMKNNQLRNQDVAVHGHSQGPPRRVEELEMLQFWTNLMARHHWWNNLSNSLGLLEQHTKTPECYTSLHWNFPPEKYHIFHLNCQWSDLKIGVFRHDW